MASAAERAGAFVRELRRRRVFRVAGASLATGLGFVYAADVILPRLDAPEWTVSLVIMLAGLGFFLAVGLAWAFDVTAEGVVRTPPAEPPEKVAPETADDDVPPQPDRRAIAVLPFENMSDDAGTEYFSDGISEEIINALAQLPELRVAGRTSAFSFKGRHEDLRTVGRKLNVGTVLEGSVRRAGAYQQAIARAPDYALGMRRWPRPRSCAASSSMSHTRDLPVGRVRPR